MIVHYVETHTLNTEAGAYVFTEQLVEESEAKDFFAKK